MTPVEDVALAITAAMVATNSDPEAMARAALLALAEAEIPDDATNAGADAIVDNDDWESGLRDCFRAMLRALAKEDADGNG